MDRTEAADARTDAIRAEIRNGADRIVQAINELTAELRRQH